MEENKKLRNENTKLREENRLLNALVVRVTGPGGSPTYAQRHIAHANETEHGFLVLDLHAYYDDKAETILPVCPIEDMERCEIHIGDQATFGVGDYSSALQRPVPDTPEQSIEYNYFDETETAEDDDDDEEDQHQEEEVVQNVSLIVKWGPTTRLERPDVSPVELRNEDIDYVRFERIAFSAHPFAE